MSLNCFDTHSISLVAMVLLWPTPIRGAWIGVVFDHLFIFMDSLTMMGVLLLEERSMRITIFGGKLRTESPGEFVLTGIIVFVAFIVLDALTSHYGYSLNNCMKMIRILSALSMLLLLFACSKSVVKPVANEEFNAELSFETANKLIDKKEYNEARALFLEIKNRDLTKKYAPLAQLRIADAYAKEDEPELAVAEYRRFLEIYPDHQQASYAQYQVAMVYFGQIEGPERGYGGAAKALAEFEKLKRDFPRNPYKELIDIRIEKCMSVMADYEYLVGDFYLKKQSYGAAIDRFETLMKKFPDYKKEDNVLLKLGIAYKGVGQKEKAELFLNRLLEKYPNSPLSKEAIKELASLTKDEKKK